MYKNIKINKDHLNSLSISTNSLSLTTACCLFSPKQSLISYLRVISSF